jgi:hypothetical protein
MNPVTKVVLKNVRLSFPSLSEPASFDGQQGKYEATFLIDKETQVDQKVQIHEKILRLLAGKPFQISAEKLCLKDGDHVSYRDYQGKWAIKASNARMPKCVDQRKNTMSPDELYAGCKVNAVIDLWLQDNKYGRRINANLYAVQFVEHGEALGARANTNPLDDLNDLMDEIPF